MMQFVIGSTSSQLIEELTARELKTHKGEENEGILCNSRNCSLTIHSVDGDRDNLLRRPCLRRLLADELEDVLPGDEHGTCYIASIFSRPERDLPRNQPDFITSSRTILH